MQVKKARPDAAQIMQDVPLMGLLKSFAEGYELHNMACERLLGAYRKASVQQFHRPNVKRVVSVGSLDTMLRAHLIAGGADPRMLTREDLKQLGTRTMKNGKTKDRGGTDKRPASWKYVNAKMSRRKVKLPFARMCSERKRLHAEFKSLSLEDQALYSSSADSHARISTPCDPDEEYTKQVGNDLWSCSNRKHPFRPDVAAKHRVKNATVVDKDDGSMHKVRS